ncbi:MAG TPA: alpha/beta fold hydrolase [Pyrinomonadaceae bacterium]|nr:alpha/beta fold hydrolase [Pyrinomonadaceae bacterium]
MNKFALFMFCCLCFAASATANAQEVKEKARAGLVAFEPYVFKSFDGKEVPAESGRLWVRENRDAGSTRLIQLAFVRLKSMAAQPAAPIVWLAGGPGVPGIVMARVPVYFRLFERLREVADVILLDQRGTGLSSPSLACPEVSPPADVFENEDKWLRAYTTLTRDCAEHWRAQGVELSAYNINASADDLDDLRRALGAERISLVGHSYGTVLAQAALRRNSEHLQRVVLANTDGTDNLLALPSVWDLLIKKLSYLAAEDAAVNKIVPDMEALYRRVLDKLDRNPVSLTITDARTRSAVNLRVGKLGLQWLVRVAMNDARTYPALPALFYTIDTGDYTLLARRVESLYNNFGGRSPMANATDCSAGWSAERLTQAQKEAAGALFSNVNLQWASDICKSVAAATNATKNTNAPTTRLWSTVPTLFVSGTLDTNTPPFQAEEVRWGFPNSAHLVVENGGHETLPSDEVQRVVVDFFKGLDVRGRIVTFERPRFLSVEEAKSQATPRR